MSPVYLTFGWGRSKTIRDFMKRFGAALASIGFSEHRHCAAGCQAGYSLKYAVFRFSLSTASDFD